MSDFAKDANVPANDCVSRQAAKDAINRKYRMRKDSVIATINRLPAADARENVRGEWILHIDDLFPAESTMECNQCHKHQPITIDDNYCPNCGAEMRREDNGRDEENHNRV